MPALRWIVDLRDADLTAAVAGLRADLGSAGLHDAGDLAPDALPGHASARPPAGTDAVVVWTDRPQVATAVAALPGRGIPVLLAGPTLSLADRDGALAEAAGLVPGAPSPPHDVRVRAGREGGPITPRLLDHSHSGSAHHGEHTHLVDAVLRIDKAADDVEVLLTASLGLAEHPVATWRPATQVLTWTLGSHAGGIRARNVTRLLVLSLRHALGQAPPAPVRVGLLGYGAIGHEHNRAVHHVAGMELTAVCDVSPQRIEAARRFAPDARGYARGEDLLSDGDVDLVVVSTPPASHASWALAALQAGKHAIVEKPFAIRTEDADAVLAEAAARGLLATVYQNRRFDPDHLAVRRAVQSGRLGEVFHLEAFVGGYGHPCNLWHSDVEVSGGAVFDWGAHVLDQLLDLVPAEVEHVTAAEHKRLWLDVTNADHSRVTARFAGGVEATFIYSDLAAALKPRWYVLGTRGAIVGHWRTERVVSRSDIGTLDEDVLAPADSPPLLDLHDPDGSVTRLVTPPAPPYAFHAELADQLQLGLPATVSGAQSRRVLAVMEAATVSAREGGRPVAPR
jgi:predicted dehydrogenase